MIRVGSRGPLDRAKRTPIGVVCSAITVVIVVFVCVSTAVAVVIVVGIGGPAERAGRAVVIFVFDAVTVVVRVLVSVSASVRVSVRVGTGRPADDAIGARICVVADAVVVVVVVLGVVAAAIGVVVGIGVGGPAGRAERTIVLVVVDAVAIVVVVLVDVAASVAVEIFEQRRLPSDGAGGATVLVIRNAVIVAIVVLGRVAAAVSVRVRRGARRPTQVASVARVLAVWDAVVVTVGVQVVRGPVAIVVVRDGDLIAGRARALRPGIARAGAVGVERVVETVTVIVGATREDVDAGWQRLEPVRDAVAVRVDVGARGEAVRVRVGGAVDGVDHTVAIVVDILVVGGAVAVEIRARDRRFWIGGEVVGIAESDRVPVGDRAEAERNRNGFVSRVGVALAVGKAVEVDRACVGVVESTVGDACPGIGGDERKRRRIRVVLGRDDHRNLVLVVVWLVEDLVVGNEVPAERLVIVRVDVSHVVNVVDVGPGVVRDRDVDQDEDAPFLDVRRLVDVEAAGVSGAGGPGDGRAGPAATETFLDTDGAGSGAGDIDISEPVVVPIGGAYGDAPGLDWRPGREEVAVVLHPSIVLGVRDEPQSTARVPPRRRITGRSERVSVTEADFDEVVPHEGVGAALVHFAVGDPAGATHRQADPAVLDAAGLVATVAGARVSIVALLVWIEDAVAHESVQRGSGLVRAAAELLGNLGAREDVRGRPFAGLRRASPRGREQEAPDPADSVHFGHGVSRHWCRMLSIHSGNPARRRGTPRVGSVAARCWYRCPRQVALHRSLRCRSPA